MVIEPISSSNYSKSVTSLQQVEGEVPDKSVTDQVSSRVTTHRHQEKDDHTKGSRMVIFTERKIRWAYAQIARAAESGRKIINDHMRILGMLESGAANRKWVIATYRWLLAQRNPFTAKSK